MRWYTTAGSDRDVLSTTTMTPSGRTFRLKGSAYEQLVNIYKDIYIMEEQRNKEEREGEGKVERGRENKIIK